MLDLIEDVFLVENKVYWKTFEDQPYYGGRKRRLSELLLQCLLTSKESCCSFSLNVSIVLVLNVHTNLGCIDSDGSTTQKPA